MYCLGWDLNIQLEFGKTRAPIPREASETPLLNSYRAGDGKWFWLLGAEADRHFPGVMRAIDHREWIKDPRFLNARSRRHNREEFIALLDAAFAEHAFDHWSERFDAEDVWWAPVQSPAEVVADPQAYAAGAIVSGERADGTTKEVIANPVGYEDAPTHMLAPPALGADTEAVLRAAGLESAQIEDLRERGLIPKEKPVSTPVDKSP
jgi:crotonobetainyl-CoA:carnitine CoA-transferase CaiB-like acyl-CoA transferase